MHVKVSNSDYIELMLCVFIVQWMLNCCTFMVREWKKRASAVWSCQAGGGSDGGLGRPLLLLLLLLSFFFFFSFFYRSTHLPFSTHGLFFISSGFRKGSSGTHSSIHFTRSVTVFEDFSLLKASWYFRLSTSFFIWGKSISSMTAAWCGSNQTRPRWCIFE